MRTLFTFCLLFTFCIGAAITTKAQVDVNDSLALVDLYNSTNGPGWKHHNKWLTGPVKDWYGIYLDGTRVSNILLRNNNLKGSIPASIGNLSSLFSLYLSYNQLSGTIPKELANIPFNRVYQDNVLDLSYNQLSGNIPSELGNLSNLDLLYLSHNQLSGNIPPELGKLSSLHYNLDLSYNQLSGSIPPELGNLSNLQSLQLSYNQLSGNIPPELGKLSSLGRLDLSNNQLNGSIPPELGNLPIYYFILSNNQLSGAIPPELGNLSIVHYLQLGNNQLSGPIPPELGNLPLSALDLAHNQLSGSIPPELGKLSILYYDFNLSYNKLSGPIPPELSNLTFLHFTLDLSHNQLSGGIPPELGKLIYLTALDLSHNKFTFDGMELIAKKFPFAIYDWQMPIPMHINGNTLSVSAGGTLSNNTYIWYQQDKPGNITIAGDSVFHPAESGTYFVKVRNKIAKDLKLVSRAVKYTALPSLDAIASNKQLELLNNSFSVYPNPAKDILHVTTNGNASFSLMSEEGKTLLTSNITRTGLIDISNVAAGVYYIKNNHTNTSKKIVVVK